MTDVILDGRTIATEADLQDVLMAQLDFGDHYGRNLNALNDRLGSDVERPIKLTWIHSEASRQSMGDELFATVVQIFERIAEHDRRVGWIDRFEYTLE